MAQVNPNSKGYDPQKQVMALLQERLKPFKVPNEILRALRDDIVATITAPEKRKSGRAAVMTASASAAADKIRKGENLPPEAGRPTQI